MAETASRNGVVEVPLGQQGGRGRGRGGRHQRGQVDLGETGVDQVDGRGRRKIKVPKLPRKERKALRKKDRHEFRRRWAVDVLFATEVFTDMLHKGEVEAAKQRTEKGRPLRERRKRKAALEYARGALDGYDFATIAPDTSSISDSLQLERVTKRIIERGVLVEDLVARVGDVNGLAEKATLLYAESEKWNDDQIKAAFKAARRYYKALSRPQRRVFDEHAKIPSAGQDWAYTAGLTSLAFYLGDGFSILTGGASLAFFKSHEYPDAKIATAMTAAAYLAWVGAIVGLSSGQNAEMIEKKGVSVDPLSKMMWEYAERKGYDERTRKKMAKWGYFLWECVVKETPWILSIAGISTVLESVFPHNKSDAASLDEAFNNITHGNFDFNEVAKGTLAGLFGAYAGGAVYEGAAAGITKLYNMRSEKDSRMIHHIPEKTK